MKPVLAVVIAHPDDEAFGPSGTIAKWSKTHDIYIICATHGEGGEDHRDRKLKPLAKAREQELKNSGKILGVKKVYVLDFVDGTLCNNIYHKLAGEIERIFNRIKPSTVITIEPRGVSGHLDHIAVSMITTYIFQKVSYTKKLMYYCISTRSRALQKPYFIYFPPGYTDAEIGEKVDTSEVFDIKVRAMHEHKSQMKDVKNVLEKISKLPKEDNYLVIKK